MQESSSGCMIPTSQDKDHLYTPLLLSHPKIPSDLILGLGFLGITFYNEAKRLLTANVYSLMDVMPSQRDSRDLCRL
jgi:hypothetical protein